MVRLYKQSVILFLGMTSLVIFSMFSYPFELLPYTIIAVMVIAWSESENKESLSVHISKMKCSVVCLIAIAFSCCLKEEVSDRIEQDEEANLFSGMQNDAFLPDYYELLPYENDNPQYLFDFAKTLRSAKRYGDSNAILRQATLVSPDPMFYVLMGNNYKDMKHYDLAEQAYQKAYSVMPNRLYPLYQLMMLYHDCGNTLKEKAMAKRVIEMKPKIESPATRDMKKKAIEII
jgi:tetratricopeptide (TPR) repeat protein